MPSLASSEGWKFRMPSGSQRRAPFTPLPMPGNEHQHQQQQGAHENPWRQLFPDVHRNAHNHPGRRRARARWTRHALPGNGWAGSWRSGGCQASAIEAEYTITSAQSEQADRDPGEQLVVAHEAWRGTARDIDPVAHGHIRRCAGGASTWQAQAGQPGRAARPAAVLSLRGAGWRFTTASPHAFGSQGTARCRRRPARDARSCGTCRGWRRRARAARSRLRARARRHQRVACSSWSKRCCTTPDEASAASIDRRVATDQGHRPCMALAPGPAAARNPGLCRHRPRITTSLAGARSSPRPLMAATVAPTLVPLLSS